MQADNLRAVRLVVSLSLNFTTSQTAHKLRLTAALDEKSECALHKNEEVDGTESAQVR